MIAPVDAINMVDVRIEDDIIRRYMKTRRKTVQEKWTLLSSYVKIQTDVDNDFQPLYDGYLTYKILELTGKALSHGVWTRIRRSSRQASF